MDVVADVPARAPLTSGLVMLRRGKVLKLFLETAL
jgi:hypothetical protein